jgi:endonuclease-3 related protein
MDLLHREKMISPVALAGADPGDLGRLIRSSGYFNQKTKKLKIIAHYFLKRKFHNRNTPGRDELLSLWGIGPETADSILLYAFGKPFFVVDAYTKRLLTRLRHISGKESYDDIQKIFKPRRKLLNTTIRNNNWGSTELNTTIRNNNWGSTELNTVPLVQYYNEYHALIVEHAKQHCKKQPSCPGCPVKKYCSRE